MLLLARSRKGALKHAWQCLAELSQLGSACLCRASMQAAAIHGDINQAQRTAAVEGFKSGKVSCSLVHS